MGRRLLAKTLVVGALTLGAVSVPAGATVTPTSYMTFNIAGAAGAPYTTADHSNSITSGDPYLRQQHAMPIVYIAQASQPTGIAVQEDCDNTDPNITDAREYLMGELASRGYQYFGVNTKTLTTRHCVQCTWIFAKGTYAWADYLWLPGTTEGESRAAVCMRTVVFVQVANCSSHLTTAAGDQQQQSFSFWAFAEQQVPYSFAVWSGGDFNTNNLNVLYPWSMNSSEGDTTLARNTFGSKKIDYSWGRLPIGQAAGGSVVAGAPNYSDHNYVFAPFNWVY